MSDQSKMKALRLHTFGEPLEVLTLEETVLPKAGPNQIRVRVEACALNPMDAILCQGFMAKSLPRGIGTDVSGTVDEVGADVSNVRVGDKVFGVPDFGGEPSAGAAEHAVLVVWEFVPEKLELQSAAAMPMSVETAARALDLLGLEKGQTIVVNGAGTMVGFAAVQMAILKGAHVIATAGDTFAGDLRKLGADVTAYGDGLADRVRATTDRKPDVALQTAASGKSALPDLINLVGGDPQRVMSLIDFGPDNFGVRTTGSEPDLVPRYDVLGKYAQLAAKGKFTIPVARTFRLDEWREAFEMTLEGRAHGKILLLPDNATRSK